MKRHVYSMKICTMVANIHPGGPVIIATKMQAETRQKESLKASSDGFWQSAGVENSDDATPAALQQKLVDMADDMANVATQFRNRREFEKKTNTSTENFDGVLDENAAKKAQKLIAISAVLETTLDQLLVQARSLFPDDSDLFLVLKELLKRRQLSSVQRNQLENMLQQVIREANPKILKGGVNCALKARLFSQPLKVSAALLRQTYRRFLESDGSAIDDYEDWVVSYGYQSRHLVLDFVEESLGIDIRSEDPSCDHLEFSYLLAHMRKLHLLRGADREFVFALLRNNLVPTYAEEEADWLMLFFALLQREPISRPLLLGTLGTSLLPTHAQRSTWLNAVRRAYKRLPSALLENPDEPDGEQVDKEIDEVIALFDQLIDESYAAEMIEMRGVSNLS